MAKDVMWKAAPELKVRVKPKSPHRVIIDIVIVFLLMAVGVIFSDQVLLSLSGDESGGDGFVLPDVRKLIIGFIVAAMFIGGTDLVVGDAEGKLKVRSRVVRYSGAVKSGIFFRMLQEAG